MKAMIIAMILSTGLSAAASRTDTYHCTIDKIDVTKFDLIHFDAGTKQEIRFLELQCDEDTFSKGSKKAFARAPIAMLADLQDRKARQSKDAYTVTQQGYAGDLVAFNGSPVSEIQPDALEGSHFVYSATDSFGAGRRLTEIVRQRDCSVLNCDDVGVSYQAKDASQFRLTARIVPGQERGGDGRGTPGDSHVEIRAEGSVELNQQPGSSLQFSARDSQVMSKFLLMTKFPTSMNFQTATLFCASSDNCVFAQQ